MTTRVAVTGAQGFLGWHVRCHAMTRSDVEIVPIDRGIFNRSDDLAEALRGVEAVIHLAGANRGEAEEVAATNVSVAGVLVSALRAIDSKAVLVYANSTQSRSTGPYGESKAKGAEILGRAATGRFVDVILPNLFGELGRPDYNSFVATFCQRIAVGDEPHIHEDRQVRLLHAQDAAAILVDAALGDIVGTASPTGHQVSVTKVASLLTSQADRYAMGLLPERPSDFERQLFNQLRSYTQPINPFSKSATRFDNPRSLDRHADARGGLVEVVKSLGGEAQTFFSTTKPGVTRGDHFHVTKLERFVVVSGQAEIAMRRLGDDRVFSLKVSGVTPSVVDIPTLFTHSITNTGDGELLTLFWTDEVFDPDRPDTYRHPVREAS